MKRVVFTREHPLQEEWVQKLNAKGYVVEHAPLILCQINAIPQRVFEELTPDTWLFFTSQVAADFFFEKANGAFDGKTFKIATIGPMTSETVEKWGFDITFASDKYYSKDLVVDWCKVYEAGEKIFIPQSSLAAKTLELELIEKGHDVLAWTMYETVFHPVGQSRIKNFLDDVPTVWAFASSSAWDSFYEVQKEIPEKDLIAVIGTTTQASVEKQGFSVAFRPDEPQIDLMIQTILDDVRIDR